MAIDLHRYRRPFVLAFLLLVWLGVPCWIADVGWLPEPVKRFTESHKSLNLPIGLLVTGLLYLLAASDSLLTGRTLRQLAEAVFAGMYRERRPRDPAIQHMYRVTCYRAAQTWYEKLWAFLRVTFAAALELRVDRIRGVWRRLWRSGSLLYCVERYGKEDSNTERKKTTLVFWVDRTRGVGEGFAGKVLLASTPWETAINNPRINKSIADVDVALWPDRVSFEPPTASLKRMEDAGLPGALGKEAWQALSSFMLRTNTNLDLLLTINPKGEKRMGTHCNHFVGFRVFRDGRDWGVVTVDALDDSSFYELIGVSASQQDSVSGGTHDWLRFSLEGWSRTFSSIVGEKVQ